MLMRNIKNRPIRLVNANGENVVVQPGDTVELTEEQLKMIPVEMETVEKPTSSRKSKKNDEEGE